MDNRLKQRLIGATVLVALAVIIIPELIRQPDEQSRPVVSTEIPPRPDQFAAEDQNMTISLPLPAELAAPETVAEAPVPGQLPSSPTLEQPVAKHIEIEAPEPESQPPLQPLDAGKPPVAIAFEQPIEPPKPATVPAKPTPSPKPVAAPKPAIATSEPIKPPDPKPVAAPKPAIATSDSIKPPEPSLPAQPSLPAKPVQAKTEVADSIVLPKIELIARADSGPISPPPTPPKPVTNHNSGWVVQAGSFSLEENANRLRDKLRAQHFAASVERITINGNPVYRVRIGPQTTQAESEKTRDRLQRELGITGNVVPLTS